jgi:nucleoside-diphosphate-sugar epimerase
MKIALTGATGFIGSQILRELHSHGHEVIALVRNDAEAGRVAASGAVPAIVDLYDRPTVTKVFGDADGAAHVASPGNELSATVDLAVVGAATDAFMGSGKPYAHISGLWVFGSNTLITEESPYNAPALVSWKQAVDQRVLDLPGVRGILIVSGTAYGNGGGGVPGILLNSPCDAEGNLIMIGTGRQHWATIHVADLAVFFRLVLETSNARGRYVVANGMTPTVAELTDAAAAAVGASGAVPGSDNEARTRLGDQLAEVLLLDQATTAAKARAVLGWKPAHPSFTDELRTGSYRG